MKTHLPLLILLLAAASCLAGCSMSVDGGSGSVDPVVAQRHNICLVLDGTDRLSIQNGVPEVSLDEVVDLARTLSTSGGGSMYVTYVDKDVDNNPVAFFEWLSAEPSAPGPKPGYMKVSEYERLESDWEAQRQEYLSRLDDAVGLFRSECARIVQSAYSDAVARERRGSDVTGAVNQAVRLLRSSDGSSERSYVVLVSDGVDNVGKELVPLPFGFGIIIVNSNASKHPFGDAVVREFASFRQLSGYLFN